MLVPVEFGLAVTRVRDVRYALTSSKRSARVDHSRYDEVAGSKESVAKSAPAPVDEIVPVAYRSNLCTAPGANSPRATARTAFNSGLSSSCPAAPRPRRAPEFRIIASAVEIFETDKLLPGGLLFSSLEAPAEPGAVRLSVGVLPSLVITLPLRLILQGVELNNEINRAF